MKIALAHKRLDLKGGTERDLYRTAEGLKNLGHEVHLFCGEYAVAAPPDTFTHSVPVLPLGRTAQLWSFATCASRFIRRHSCDIVMGFGRLLEQDIIRCGGGSHRGFLDRFGRDGGGSRRLWQKVSVYHQSVLAIEKRQFQRGRFKKILAVSEEVKRDLMEHYALSDDRIEVIYNGVDTLRFHPSRRREARSVIRERWKIPMEAPLVLFVGSGFRRKGLDRMLRAWNTPDCAPFYLLVVGDDARIGYYKAWAESVAPRRIVFTGPQKDIENYYGAADVVALPSLQEAFGNVVLEGLASGLPILLSRAVGAAELLKGSLAEGILDRAEDEREFGGKIIRLLDQGRDPAFVVEARRVSEGFSWQHHFRKLEAMLVELNGSNNIGTTT